MEMRGFGLINHRTPVQVVGRVGECWWVESTRAPNLRQSSWLQVHAERRRRERPFSSAPTGRHARLDDYPAVATWRGVIRVESCRLARIESAGEDSIAVYSSRLVPSADASG